MSLTDRIQERAGTARRTRWPDELTDALVEILEARRTYALEHGWGRARRVFSYRWIAKALTEHAGEEGITHGVILTGANLAKHVQEFHPGLMYGESEVAE